jgi:hypothetical protein
MRIPLITRLGEGTYLSRDWVKQALFSLSLFAMPAVGAVLDITADFRPDPIQPFLNEFRNTTPVSGYCIWLPKFCGQGISSLIIPLTTEPVAVSKDLTDIQDGAMIRMTNEVRQVTVTGRGGASETVNFSIARYGGEYHVAPTVQIITGVSDTQNAHRQLWKGGSWATPPAQCSYGGSGGFGVNKYRFFWINRTGGACGKLSSFDIPSFHFADLSIAYSLTTPNPLGMREGEYTGEVTYTVGPGGDIDFGRVAEASDSEMTFRFTLYVGHVFKMHFPPGADRLALVPQGGWNSWLQSGRVPEKLTANQDFQISTSIPFKMSMACTHEVGDQCAIANGSGDLVAVETRVTLPSALETPGGQPVSRMLLNNKTAVDIRPTRFVDNGRAALHFEVPRSGVEQMTRSAGTRYSGSVTFIVDGDI